MVFLQTQNELSEIGYSGRVIRVPKNYKISYYNKRDISGNLVNLSLTGCLIDFGDSSICVQVGDVGKIQFRRLSFTATAIRKTINSNIAFRFNKPSFRDLGILASLIFDL